jgi:membrane fusion protein (multidrug efflux system)
MDKMRKMIYPIMQRPGKMRLKIVIPVVILLLVVIFWLTRDGENHNYGSTGENAEQAKIFPVEVTKVAFERVEHYLEAVGSFLPEDEVTISTEVEGIIKKRFVDEGDQVKRGDVLIKIDDEKFRLQVEETEASLREAEATLKNAKGSLSRMEQLLSEKVVDQQRYDDTFTKFHLGKAMVENVRAKLKRYQRSLNDTEIVAPLDGVVSERMGSEGEYVKVGAELLKVVEINPLKLTFTLPEKFSGQVRMGQTVEVKAKAFPGEVFTGSVYFISPTVNLATRTLEVKAKVENKDYRLKPGFFVDVKLLTDVNEQAMVLPEGAVVMREEQFVVLTVQEEKIQFKSVMPGKRFEGKVEILEGVGRDDIMVVSGLSELTEGSKVSIAPSTPQL